MKPGYTDFPFTHGEAVEELQKKLKHDAKQVMADEMKRRK
jgi:hypothetical protein